MSFLNQLENSLKEKLPKQTAPIMRSVGTAQWNKASSVESAAAKHPCGHLTGLSRQLCMMTDGS